jgi:beta-glucosidase
MTFPRTVGQVPIYYSQKNTGKPANADNFVHVNDIETGAEQTSFGMSSMHLDAGFTPLFPFGFGLSYTEFGYSNIRASSQRLRMGGSIRIRADVSNNGPRAAVEVVQLYTRDLVGSVTRPVRELKGFQRVLLEPGQTREVSFELHADDLAFFNRDSRREAEPGVFHAWIGGSSRGELKLPFEIRER